MIKKIKSGLCYLDNVILQGGIPTSTITELQGLPSSWRSSLARAFHHNNPGSIYFNQDEAPRAGEASLETTSQFVSKWKNLDVEGKLLVIDGTDAMISYEEKMTNGVIYPNDKRNYDIKELYQALRNFAVSKNMAVIVTANLYLQEKTQFCWTETKEDAREYISTTIRCSSQGTLKNNSGLPIAENVRFTVTQSTILDVNKNFTINKPPQLERGIYKNGLDPLWSRFIYLIYKSKIKVKHGRVYQNNKEMRMLGRTTEYQRIIENWNESFQ